MCSSDLFFPLFRRSHTCESPSRSHQSQPPLAWRPVAATSRKWSQSLSRLSQDLASGPSRSHLPIAVEALLPVAATMFSQSLSSVSPPSHSHPSDSSLPTMRCPDCGKQLLRLVSGTDDNPGRVFYKCLANKTVPCSNLNFLGISNLGLKLVKLG